jgi:hypothetical protein
MDGLCSWIRTILGETSKDNDLQAYITGENLCKLINVLRAGLIPFIRTTENTSVKFLRDYDNVNAFLGGCRALGVEEAKICEWKQIVNFSNPAAIMTTLDALRERTCSIENYPDNNNPGIALASSPTELIVLPSLISKKFLETKQTALFKKAEPKIPVSEAPLADVLTRQKKLASDLVAIKVDMTSQIHNISAQIHTQINERVCILEQELVREKSRRLKTHHKLLDLQGQIRVFCRIRPMTLSETDAHETPAFNNVDENSLSLVGNDRNIRHFTYDRVFKPQASQAEVYAEVSPLVESSLEGYRACIFAYGQTGSGKTFTMEGTPQQPGVIPQALQQLFAASSAHVRTHTYTFTMSVVEIYLEEVRDLLSTSPSSQKLEVRELQSEVVVPGLKTETLSSAAHALEVINLAMRNRQCRETAMNEHSSRSHCMITINTRALPCEGKEASVVLGKLILIDLAGSERVHRSEVTGAAKQEASAINRSLSDLGTVMAALKRKASHVPFRNSKLTFLLQSALGKAGKCLMICQLNPCLSSQAESVSSLNFANVVSDVQLGAAKKLNESKDVLDRALSATEALKQEKKQFLTDKKSWEKACADAVADKQGLKEDLDRKKELITNLTSEAARLRALLGQAEEAKHSAVTLAVKRAVDETLALTASEYAGLLEEKEKETKQVLAERENEHERRSRAMQNELKREFDSALALCVQKERDQQQQQQLDLRQRHSIAAEALSVQNNELRARVHAQEIELKDAHIKMEKLRAELQAAVSRANSREITREAGADPAALVAEKVQGSVSQTRANDRDELNLDPFTSYCPLQASHNANTSDGTVSDSSNIRTSGAGPLATAVIHAWVTNGGKDMHNPITNTPRSRDHPHTCSPVVAWAANANASPSLGLNATLRRGDPSDPNAWTPLVGKYRSHLGEDPATNTNTMTVASSLPTPTCSNSSKLALPEVIDLTVENPIDPFPFFPSCGISSISRSSSSSSVKRTLAHTAMQPNEANILPPALSLSCEVDSVVVSPPMALGSDDLRVKVERRIASLYSDPTVNNSPIASHY